MSHTYYIFGGALPPFWKVGVALAPLVPPSATTDTYTNLKRYFDLKQSSGTHTSTLMHVYMHA